VKATLQELKEAKRILNGLSTANLLPESVTTPLLLILAHWIADAERKPELKECTCAVRHHVLATGECCNCGGLHTSGVEERWRKVEAKPKQPASSDCLCARQGYTWRIRCETCGGIVTLAVLERWRKAAESYFGAVHSWSPGSERTNRSAGWK